MSNGERSFNRTAHVARLCAAGVAFAIALGARPASALDNHTFHPAFNARMSVSDRSTTAGVQPWVWTATTGDASGSLLVAKKADVSSTDAWTLTFATSLTSAPEAISWTDGTNARQRVFFSSGGSAQMLDWDNNAQNSFVTLPNASTFSVPFGDFAAVTWVSLLTRRFALVGYAAKNGVNGHLCFWEKTSTATTWSVSCTASPVMSGTNNPLPDIVGAVQGSTPVFFFRNAAGRLARARRTNVAAYTIEELGTDALGPSLFATNSQASGAVDVGVIRSSDNRVRVARLASATSLTPTWTTLPALPSGAVPATSSNVVLSGASYPISSVSTRTQVAVIASNLRLHTIRTTENTGTTWESAWTAGVVPGRSTTPNPEQVVAALGPTLGNPPGNGARLFFVGAGAFGADFATTMQEYWHGFPRPWKDHVRMTFITNGGLEPSVAGAIESSMGGGPVFGVAGAIQRNNPPPWRVLVAGSDDGGSSFSPTITATSLFDSPSTPRSMSDPNLTHGGFGGHLLHFTSVELFKSPIDCSEDATNNLITYRRGTNANDIANSFTAVVAANGELDHPGIAVTVDANDAPTAHILYWDVGQQLTKYWTLSPGDVPAGPFTISSLPNKPAGVVVGNFQSQVYGWTFSNSSTFPTICKMNGSQGTNLVCGVPNVDPKPNAAHLFYGAQVTDAQNGICPGLASGTQTRFYKCFDHQQPWSIYADPTQANRLHIAYTATDSATGRRAIFYTRNTDSNLATWTPPVKIASDATRELLHPAISVDYDGTIVVTYTRIQEATFNTPTDGSAEMRVTWSTLDSGTWSTAAQIVETWDADNLPFHCSREKWFAGEYRYPDVVAGRAQHLMMASSGAPGGVVSQRASWFSGSFNLN